MKWGILVLSILGIVAAICAAVLVGAVRLNPFAADANDTQGIEVVVARRDLPAMTTLTGDCFDKIAVSKADLPTGKVISATGSLGRILAVSVVKGQVLTESCLVWEGAGAQLAAKLADGMRAFTVNLSRGIPDRALLYPGCVVDVLFSAKLSGRDERGQAISATILRGIQVLAVAGDSVVSNPTAGQEAKRKPKGTSRALSVTLMVDSKQAEALQLASNNGVLSLAIRNPLDKNLGNMEATVLSQGQLAALSSVLSPEILAAAQIYGDDSKQAGGGSQPAGSVDPNGQAEKVATVMTAVPLQPIRLSTGSQAREPKYWGVTVIRGRETKVEELAESESKEEGDSTDR